MSNSSSVAPTAHRRCVSCRRELPQSQFSKKQWARSPSKCAQCMQNSSSKRADADAEQHVPKDQSYQQQHQHQQYQQHYQQQQWQNQPQQMADAHAQRSMRADPHVAPAMPSYYGMESDCDYAQRNLMPDGGFYHPIQASYYTLLRQMRMFPPSPHDRDYHERMAQLTYFQQLSMQYEGMQPMYGRSSTSHQQHANQQWALYHNQPSDRQVHGRNPKQQHPQNQQKQQHPQPQPKIHTQQKKHKQHSADAATADKRHKQTHVVKNTTRVQKVKDVADSESDSDEYECDESEHDESESDELELELEGVSLASCPNLMAAPGPKAVSEDVALCVDCKRNMPVSAFSKTQLKHAPDKRRCMACIANSMRCATCGQTKPKPAFSKTQSRKNRGSRVCSSCVSEAATPTCADCKRKMSASAFSKTQLRNAPHKRRCTTCIANAMACAKDVADSESDSDELTWTIVCRRTHGIKRLLLSDTTRMHTCTHDESESDELELELEGVSLASCPNLMAAPGPKAVSEDVALCVDCKRNMPVSAFSKTQLKNAPDKRRCMACIANSMRCATCGQTKPKPAFSKTQSRKNRGSRVCSSCVSEASTPTCADCKRWMSASAFSKTQLRNAPHKRRCTTCITNSMACAKDVADSESDSDEYVTRIQKAGARGTSKDNTTMSRRKMNQKQRKIANKERRTKNVTEKQTKKMNKKTIKEQQVRSTNAFAALHDSEDES